MILAIVNALGLTESAGIGVVEKVCAFIMLVPAAFMQSMSAFVAQNRGAKKPERVVKALKYAIGVSLFFAVTMFYISFFHGDLLSWILAKDNDVMAASAQYLKAYAIVFLQPERLLRYWNYLVMKTGADKIQNLRKI